MDRKRKIEDDCNNSESENENSPSKRRRHKVDFKLKLVKEAKMYNLSEISRKYKVTRFCIREWTKDEKKLSEIIKAQGTRCTVPTTPVLTKPVLCTTGCSNIVWAK